MADEEGVAAEVQLTFNVKASSDAKHTVTVPSNMTVLDLKKKLSTSDYANIPHERQRLIYSGRVMKDADALASYKIKDGNTVHLVKSAESTQRSNPANQSSAAPTVPQNLATGTANDPLAALTGARYAGYHNLPSSDTFGPDGGMTPQSPDEMLRRMEDPAFIQQMNETLNNPDVIRMMRNRPEFRDNPQALRLLEDPNLRRMMMDPNVIRQSMQMARNMGMGPGSTTGGGMPMPGATDTTPQQPGTGTGGQANAASGAQAANPFAQLFPGAAAGGAGFNPFAALGGQHDPMANLFGNMNSQNTGGNDAAGNNAPNPGDSFASLLEGGSGGAGGFGGMNPQMMQAALEHMRQNPEQARMAMNMLLGSGSMGPGAAGTPGAPSQPGSEDQARAPAPFNPFAAFGGLGGFAPPPPPASDSRPPEEQYADQLRQLNDMGFFDFNQNVRALRMSGGRVEGAVEMLLAGLGGP